MVAPSVTQVPMNQANSKSNSVLPLAIKKAQNRVVGKPVAPFFSLSLRICGAIATFCKGVFHVWH